jgi:hypothetical protein
VQLVGLENESNVLRITQDTSNGSALLKLEGSIRGPWVSELAKAWRLIADSKPSAEIRVELGGVSFADWEGRKLLLDMENGGAKLVAPSVFLRHMLAEHVRAAAGTPSKAQGGIQ